MESYIWYIDRAGKWKPVKVLPDPTRKQSEQLWKEIEKRINNAMKESEPKE